MQTTINLLLFVGVLIAFAQAANWTKLPRLRRLHRIRVNEIAQKKGRIVGGEWADYGQFPYQAGIYGNERAIFCGGSLITPDRVLTAGQCASGVTGFEIHFGAVLIYDETEAGRQVVISDQAIVHSNYDVDLNYNDIALIILPSPVSGQNIAPIKVPSYSMSGDSFVGVMGTATGWGGRGFGKLYQVLEFVDLRVIEKQGCEKSFTAARMENQICVSTENGTVGTCHGDMGGPLVYNGVVIGIMSSIEPTFCNRGEPVAFTKVTDYLTWLEDTGGIPIDP